MIQLQYLAHSSFLITCGKTKLVLDPWLKGPAYYKQWFLWPLPACEPEDLDVDAILISHGHEDHLHSQTLRKIPKQAEVIFPFQWRAGIKPFLNSMGFNKVTEAVSFRTYNVNDVKVTYIGFSLESVVIIEYKNEVIININDALNSNHENAVDFILKEIQERWPKIDYLLSGWSGASYFPNQIRYPDKNDKEIGKLREQYFANNFCRFASILKPKFALPFASGFVLLAEENLWINHIKFPRNKVSEYYELHFKDEHRPEFIVAYPGDRIKNGFLSKNSQLHSVEEQDQYDLAYKHYGKELQEMAEVSFADETEIGDLVKQLKYWVNFNKQLYHQKVIKDVFFSVKLNDTKGEVYLNVTNKNGEFEVERSDDPLPERRLVITTSAKKLLFGFKKVWGGDVLTIGYGLIVDMYDQLSLEKNLDIVCVRLITRYPMARKDLVKYPLRAFKYYTYNPKITSLWVKQKIVLKPYVNKYPYNERDHWMLYNKCDLCAVCKMPEIDLAAYPG
jgi:hypothetical protein